MVSKDQIVVEHPTRSRRVERFKSHLVLGSFFCLIFSSFFLLDKVYTAQAREQRFDEKDIRNQANLAKYLEKDDYDWNYIDSFLEKLGNTFSFST